jgi:hypothetical protein
VDRDDGGPAFPTNLSDDGMSLRDYFAAKAMQSIMADGKQYSGFDEIAEYAYEVADAMLAERSKP